MRHLSTFHRIALLTLASSVAACAPARAHVADPCEGLVTWPLYVAGLPAEPLAAFLRQNPDLARALIYNDPGDRLLIPAGSLREFDGQLPIEDLAIGGLGIDLELSDLVDLLRRLDQEPRAVEIEVPEALRGLAGLSTALFLMKMLPLPEDGIEEPPIADKILMGRIRDYTYVEATGRGHLSVDTCTDVLEFVPLDEDRREFIHWDIEVVEGGFGVMARQDPADVANPADYGEPFPGIGEALPAFSVDPADPRSIWRRGLNHKLHASSMGLEIAHIHYRRLADPDLVRFDDSHPWYVVTEQSCVDMFTVGYPPGTFGELVSRGYCLGRCAHPPIVNSGD